MQAFLISARAGLGAERDARSSPVLKAASRCSVRRSDVPPIDESFSFCSSREREMERKT